ncbi:MAG: nascent polypeptide-associated complex protein [Thermoplasmata archaeon]|nr:nascent polypeptide-associated complex protein [Thermoplasmata archaeon]
MMPGMGRMNPKQMKKILKRQGIDIDELEGVTEVVIRMPGRTLVFDAPAVTIMRVQGQETYQVVGTPREAPGQQAGKAVATPAAPAEPKAPAFPEVDIQLVADNAKVSREEAIAALARCRGNPAEAIIMLTNG